MKLLAIFLLCCLSPLATCSDAILLEDVGALTFYKGQMSASRRSHAIPQLRCVGSECRSGVEPSVVQCKNSGSAGGGNVQWECKAELPAGYQLGSVNVNCEGYNNPNDRYILRGSCGLEYSITHSGSGSGSSRGSGGWFSGSTPHHEHHSDHYYSSPHSTSHKAGISSSLIFLALIGLGIWFCFFRGTRYVTGAPPSRGSTFGGLFGGNRFRQDTTSSGSGPGFWTGLLGGSTMGYLFGRRTGRNYATSPTTGRTYYTTQPTSPSSPREREERHESTGFGGTTRR